MNYNIVAIPGDGIGPEIVREAKKVLDKVGVVLTGHKLTQKIYRHHSSYIGGMKEIQAKDMLANNPEKMMTLAVTGMLPHNSLGRQMAKKLRVYAGAEHENMAQKPEIWNF